MAKDHELPLIGRNLGHWEGTKRIGGHIDAKALWKGREQHAEQGFDVGCVRPLIPASQLENIIRGSVGILGLLAIIMFPHLRLYGSRRRKER
jgi:hypothetical protein